MPERTRHDLDPFEKHAADTKRIATHRALTTSPATVIVDTLTEAIDAAVTAATDRESFLSYKQLSARWGVSRRALERLSLPSYKFGGQVRFKKADILAHEEQSRTL